MLLGFGKFHGFATAVWNFALLFHLVGICGKLQPSICGKVAEKDVEIFLILLNKMWKIVDTNVENSKLFFVKSGEIIEIYVVMILRGRLVVML